MDVQVSIQMQPTTLAQWKAGGKGIYLRFKLVPYGREQGFFAAGSVGGKLVEHVAKPVAKDAVFIDQRADLMGRRRAAAFKNIKVQAHAHVGHAGKFLQAGSRV